jgi:hypothetical protein
MIGLLCFVLVFYLGNSLTKSGEFLKDVGGSEHSAMSAAVSLLNPQAMADKLSRTHRGEGICGRCFMIPKTRRGFVDTSARTSLAPKRRNGASRG